MPSSYTQALDVALRAIEESPNDSARHALLGLIYAGLGQKEQALAGQRALGVSPGIEGRARRADPGHRRGANSCD